MVCVWAAALLAAGRLVAVPAVAQKHWAVWRLLLVAAETVMLALAAAVMLVAATAVPELAAVVVVLAAAVVDAATYRA